MRTWKTVPNLFFAALLSLAFIGCESDCPDTICYDDQLNPVCGDGRCDWLEFGICPEDCVICGDGICDESERGSCTLDCYECGNGICEDAERGWCIRDCHRCSNQETYAILVPCDDVQYCWGGSPCDECGDGVCTWLEDYTRTCPDCPSFSAECGDGVCNWWEVGVCYEDCWMVCGDGHCDELENADACPEDCAVCGDGHCHPGEERFCNTDCFSHGS